MSDKVLDPNLYINRELSWIAFNERVLVQALDERTPLLEQAKFSAIFSNNLDEFFMVRVASLKAQVEAGIEKLSEDGRTPIEQLHAIRERLTPLLHNQQEHYRSRLKSQLLDHGAHLLDYEQLNERQRLWVDNYFQTAIFPVLTPLAVDPAHPFPFREQSEPECGSSDPRPPKRATPTRPSESPSKDPAPLRHHSHRSRRR
jgi:Polyphosphate kinase